MCDLTVEFLKTVPFFCYELCEHLVCDNFPTYFILHHICPYLGCPVHIHLPWSILPFLCLNFLSVLVSVSCVFTVNVPVTSVFFPKSQCSLYTFALFFICVCLSCSFLVLWLQLLRSSFSLLNSCFLFCESPSTFLMIPIFVLHKHFLAFTVYLHVLSFLRSNCIFLHFNINT